jgi:hypothetical protein
MPVIQGHDIAIEPRYAEGHVLLANEASALNQLRFENIRNNVASRIKAAAEAQGANPESIDLDNTFVGEGDSRQSVRENILAYAQGYEFGARVAGTGSTRRVTDPVEREALSIARERVNAALKSRSIDRKSLPEGKFEQLLDKAVGNPDVQKEARRRVKAKEAIGADELGDELAGLDSVVGGETDNAGAA